MYVMCYAYVNDWMTHRSHVLFRIKYTIKFIPTYDVYERNIKTEDDNNCRHGKHPKRAIPQHWRAAALTFIFFISVSFVLALLWITDWKVQAGTQTANEIQMGETANSSSPTKCI